MTICRMWIEHVLTDYDDVYILPVRAGIEYMKNPVRKDETWMNDAFRCDDLPEFTCFSPRNCRQDIQVPGSENATFLYCPYCQQRGAKVSLCLALVLD